MRISQTLLTQASIYLPRVHHFNAERDGKEEEERDREESRRKRELEGYPCKERGGGERRRGRIAGKDSSDGKKSTRQALYLELVPIIICVERQTIF